MLNKLVLTQELVIRCPNAPTVDEAMRTWWMNIRDGGGLRLSHKGYQTFSTDLELHSYEFELDPNLLTSKNILALDHHLTCPYYVVNNRKHNKIVMFGSREAMMAVLHGNMQQFINSLTY
jgi:hypothetical protein